MQTIGVADEVYDAAIDRIEGFRQSWSVVVWVCNLEGAVLRLGWSEAPRDVLDDGR